MVPLIDRAIAKIELGDGCWNWTGAGEPYGQIREGGRGSRLVYAYRVVFEFFRHAIAPGLDIDHLCRNPRCVRPSHLEPVTHGENVRRGNSPNAITHRARVCKRGHPYEGNRTNGSRSYCKACVYPKHNERKRARHLEGVV